MARRDRALRTWASDWGTRSDELAAALPCDPLLPDAPLVLHRAVSVAAEAARVWRWLCQLRAAPYSYDWLDNFGRRSPQQLTPGLDELATGQRAMTIFRVMSFTRGEHLTLRHATRATGEYVVTYATRPDGDGTRLLARFRATPPPLPPFVREPLTTAGVVVDLAMARRQLLNLKALAERDARAAS